MTGKTALIAAVAAILWLNGAGPSAAALLGRVRIAALQGSPRWWLVTPDAWHVAFLSDIGDKEVWFLDGRTVASAPSDSICQRGASKDMVWVEAQLSRDGRRLAYVQKVQDSLGTVLGRVVVSNGRRQTLYDDVTGLTMSEDGRHLVYIGRRGGRAWVVVDGRPGPAVVEPGDLQLNGAGKFSYQARIQDRVWLCIGHRPLLVWPAGDVIFSPDWRRLASVRRSSASRQVYVGDRPIGASYSAIRAVTFSADGRRLAFIGERSEAGPAQVVSDGVEAGPELDEVKLSSATELYFSTADRSLNWFGRVSGSWHLYNEGRAEGDWDAILGRPALAFSPGGRRAYAAVKSGKTDLVVDGKAAEWPVGPDGGLVPGSGLVFDNEQELHFLEMGSRDVYLVCTSAGILSGSSTCLKKARQMFSAPSSSRRSVGTRPGFPGPGLRTPSRIPRFQTASVSPPRPTRSASLGLFPRGSGCRLDRP